jgi:shikimate kinase
MNITLIGMPGAGKSFVGKKLAEKLNYKFIDVDNIIEEKTKLKLQELLDKYGEDKFLEIEEKTVLELGEIDKCVISPGGSIIYSEKTMNFLKKISKIVFLYDTFENLNKRIKDKETRGMIGLKAKSFKDLFEERMVLYKKYADITVNIPEDLNADVVVEEILKNFVY